MCFNVKNITCHVYVKTISEIKKYWTVKCPFDQKKTKIIWKYEEEGIIGL